MDPTDQENHRKLGLAKGRLFHRIGLIESQQIGLAGRVPQKARCDVEGCTGDQSVLHLVDDHGVDTWLCEEHYRQWRQFEKELDRKLKELGLRK